MSVTEECHEVVPKPGSVAPNRGPVRYPNIILEESLLFVSNLTDNYTPPIVIGGVGGSGTRLVAQCLNDLKFYLGNDLTTLMTIVGSHSYLEG